MDAAWNDSLAAAWNDSGSEFRCERGTTSALDGVALDGVALDGVALDGLRGDELQD